jgi:hypothetical protein
MFGLPMDRPLVRPSCSLKVYNYEGKLMNVHLGLLKQTQSDVGDKYAISGDYVYFHYSHDGIDDRGWGCAYRSLQTLVSWVTMQHYASVDIPSIYQIQRILVNLE